MTTDVTKSTLPTKKNRDLAEELLARFPNVDRADLLKALLSWCFFQMRWGNKREERAACDVMNEVQALAVKLNTIKP